MKLFGFEVSGVQSLSVVCPRCKSPTASLTFAPSEKNTPLVLLNADLMNLFKDMELLNFFQLPQHEDLHFLCMNCMTVMKYCEQFKGECKIQVKKVEGGEEV